MNLLSVVWNVDPVIFSIGPISIRYYALLFVSGFILGYYIFLDFYKREGLPQPILDTFLFAMLISTLIGSRLGHVLFYDPAYYLAHPAEILMTWKGGLASHGGAIGLLLGTWWYTNKFGKKYGFDYLWILDRLVIVVCFAGALIRLGNLFNSEIYGNPTDLPWGFIFQLRGETVAKHPTQLYEALLYIVLGLVLLFMYRRYLPKLRRGTIFGIFLIVLFGGRFMIEFIKEPQVAFEESMTLNMGQWLSVPFVIAGIIILILSFRWTRPAMLTKVEPQRQVKKEKDNTLKYSKSIKK